MTTPTPRWRHRLRGVAIVALTLLLADKIVSLATATPPVGQFRSAEAATDYDVAYAAAMATMPPPSRVLDVPTRFGSVRVTEWSRAEVAGRTPVLLTPGWGSGAPMWNGNVRDFTTDRPVIAVDSLGDAGRSVQRVPLRSTADHASWLAETLDALEIGRVHVVGHSFGAATGTAMAVHHPARVASLAQLEPVLVYAPLPLSTIVLSIPSSLPFLPQAWRDRALAEIGGVTIAEVRSNDPVAQLVRAGTRGYAQALPMPRPLTDDEVHRLSMPVYVGLGATSLAGSGAEQRARDLLPRGTVVVWPGTTHSLPMQAATQVDAELVRFWAASE